METIVQDYLKKQYVSSEVVSGEFIFEVTIPEDLIPGAKLTRADVIEGIQEFLDWDDSPVAFAVSLNNGNWKAIHINNITYRDKEYPVRIFNVEVTGHGYEASYMVAQEKLYEAIEIDLEDERDEATRIDDTIYHYVEDDVFWLPGPEICEKYLDIPMKFLGEVEY